MVFKGRNVLYLVTFSVSLGFLTAGVTSGWMTPALKDFKFHVNETGVDIKQTDIWMLSFLNPSGFIVGALLMQFLADRFGRRVTILVSAVPVAFGSVLLAFAQSLWLLCTGFFIKNIGTGILSSVIGIYHAEVADKDVRAQLSFISSFMFKFGLVLISGIGPYISYRTMNYSIVFLPFLYFAACWWIPETPYYHLKEGNVDGARKSLKKLRGTTDDRALEFELDSIKMAVSKETSGNSRKWQTYKELLLGTIKGKQYRRAMIIAFGFKTAAMFTGGVILNNYLSWIMMDAGIKLDIKHVILIYSVISFFVGLMSTLLVDRMGRKPLIMYSFLGTGVSLFVIGLYFFLNNVIGIPLEDLSTYAFVPLLAIVMVNVLSTMGFNSLIHILPAEIFPLNVKASAMTLLHVYGSILGACNGSVFGRLYSCQVCEGIHHNDCTSCTPPYAYSAYWVFAGFGFAGAYFTKSCVIETKGKELSEIQRELQGKAYDEALKPDIDGTELEELNTKNPKTAE